MKIAALLKCGPKTRVDGHFCTGPPRDRCWLGGLLALQKTDGTNSRLRLIVRWPFDEPLAAVEQLDIVGDNRIARMWPGLAFFGPACVLIAALSWLGFRHLHDAPSTAQSQHLVRPNGETFAKVEPHKSKNGRHA